jgi:hypothetical protein
MAKQEKIAEANRERVEVLREQRAFRTMGLYLKEQSKVVSIQRQARPISLGSSLREAA